MRIWIAFIIMGCLAITGAYALDEETTDRIIDVYNITVSQYALIVQVLTDLRDEKITNDSAVAKIDEWKKRYDEKTYPIPQEAKKMCYLMNEMIDSARNVARDYAPNNLKTKDALKELDAAKRNINKEMTELKYMLQ